MTAPEIKIESATTKDIEAIAAVLHASFAEFKSFYTPVAFRATTPTASQLLERWEEGPVWVAVQGAEIVGTVAAVLKSSGLYVRSMAVHPTARRQGLASQLLKKVESFAIDHQQKQLFLSTTPFLTAAIHLYKRFGFQCSDEGPHDLFGTPLFTMVKELITTNTDSSNKDRT